MFGWWWKVLALCNLSLLRSSSLICKCGNEDVLLSEAVDTVSRLLAYSPSLWWSIMLAIVVIHYKGQSWLQLKSALVCTLSVSIQEVHKGSKERKLNILISFNPQCYEPQVFHQHWFQELQLSPDVGLVINSVRGEFQLPRSSLSYLWCYYRARGVAVTSGTKSTLSCVQLYNTHTPNREIE